MKKTQTRRALLMSVLSLLLCCSMLIGTTFAWFTDTVESGKNQIIAGNLDVELYWSTNATQWEKVNKDTNVFKEDTLWEPGHTEVVYLKVVNEGTLALKYNLSVKIASETPGINVAGDPFKLSDYIKFNVLKNGTAYANRDAAREAAEAGATKLNAPYSKGGSLQPKSDDATVHDEDIVTLVVYMPETVGNEANFKTGTNAPVINLGISLFATQFTQENDSFGNDYDENAAWAGDATTSWYGDGTASTFTLESASDLAGLAQLVNAGNSFEGKTIELDADIDLSGILWTPIGKSGSPFKGTFLGNGHTISNLKAVGSKHVGLFGNTFVGAHIEGVNVVNAEVSGNDYVGVILGGGYLAANCIKNCTVENATVTATPYLMDDGVTYDGGAKAGGIVGQAYNGSIIGCTVKNATIIAYRDLGGIAGMLAFDGSNREVEASGNTVDTVTVTYLSLNAPYNENTPNKNLAAVVGRVGNLAVVEADANTVKDVTVNDKAVMICTLEELIAFAKDVNAGNTYAGKTVILGDNIDLANMEWTPIGTTEGGFKGIFDGNSKIISNLKITGNKSTVGLFANTYNGEIKNLTVKNAKVSGRLNVGVVAGNPYTSKYTNITVQGLVEVNGMAYVGGVGGKNAYANWTNITVDVKEESYVKAISTENGSAYRTYVGGVVGFNGEGGHTFKNITSNIDVIGDVCDIGGVFGIAHYGNNFENITCTGNVTNLISAENDGDDAATDVLETGLIAGVWNNGGADVTFTNVSATGEIFTPNVTPASEFPYGGLVGKAYSASGTGKLIIKNEMVIGGFDYIKDGVTGDLILDNIPADYTEKTVTIPEGTTVIGGYAFANNQNIEKIVLPTTVTTLNDRAFRDTSASTVVLNEGLTNISYQAFRNALNVKSVVIPSTVTTISKEAFQHSGIKEIVIPANVTEIEYGGLRDMKELEKVTIEGNVDIPIYAFRACTNLKTVILKGENVTFGGGSRGMIFTNKEDGDGSAITVTVANEVVKARLLAADTAAKDYGGYTIICEHTADADGVYTDGEGNQYAFVNDGADMSTVIAGGADKVYLSDGNFVVPNTTSGKTVDIIGNGETVIDITTVPTYAGLPGATITFENVIIKSDPQGAGYNRGFAHTNKVTYNNCVINGTLGLNTDTEFNNCTFNISGDFYSLWTWGAENVTLTGCTFNSDGKALLLYGGANTKLTLNDCTFNDKGGLSDKKAAIEIGNDYNTSYELIVNNTTVNGYEINDKGINTGTTLWGNKNSMGTDKLNVVVDGVDVY